MAFFTIRQTPDSKWPLPDGSARWIVSRDYVRSNPLTIGLVELRELHHEAERVFKKGGPRLTVWDAPAEAEANCSQLQISQGVDLVLSSEVDCFLFGGAMRVRLETGYTATIAHWFAGICILL
jgi:XPG I-region